MYLDEQVETLEVQVHQALLQSCVVFVPPLGGFLILCRLATN